MSSEICKQILEKLDHGLASQAAKMLIEESRRQLDGEPGDQRFAYSDALARLGVRLHLRGDDPERKKYQRELAAYQTADRHLQKVYQQLLKTVERYVTILQRLPPLIEDCSLSMRFPSPFERMILGLEPAFDGKMQDYVLGAFHADLKEFLRYTYDFSNEIAIMFTRRSIKPGLYHAYAEILLDLGNPDADLQKIEILQKRVLDLLEKQRSRPFRPLMTAHDNELWDCVEHVLASRPEANKQPASF
ncbi:hypothetical protein GTP46_20055 [Duganella sp. FT135W]|uniref:Uncharacterized protein n=1 Tax=Duganella flavida TaxID=2692175 RepID=A0A6L8KBS2_9BURK|nr:hypothetical protein [Duganella flavida]MYM24929.1 hypothetical protein [Duganella flavida]